MTGTSRSGDGSSSARSVRSNRVRTNEPAPNAPSAHTAKEQPREAPKDIIRTASRETIRNPVRPQVAPVPVPVISRPIPQEIFVPASNGSNEKRKVGGGIPPIAPLPSFTSSSVVTAVLQSDAKETSAPVTSASNVRPNIAPSVAASVPSTILSDGYPEYIQPRPVPWEDMESLRLNVAKDDNKEHVNSQIPPIEEQLQKEMKDLEARITQNFQAINERMKTIGGDLSNMLKQHLEIDVTGKMRLELQGLLLDSEQGLTESVALCNAKIQQEHTDVHDKFTQVETTLDGITARLIRLETMQTKVHRELERNNVEQLLGHVRTEYMAHVDTEAKRLEAMMQSLVNSTIFTGEALITADNKPLMVGSMGIESSGPIRGTQVEGVFSMVKPLFSIPAPTETNVASTVSTLVEALVQMNVLSIENPLPVQSKDSDIILDDEFVLDSNLEAGTSPKSEKSLLSPASETTRVSSIVSSVSHVSESQPTDVQPETQMSASTSTPSSDFKDSQSESKPPISVVRGRKRAQRTRS